MRSNTEEIIAFFERYEKRINEKSELLVKDLVDSGEEEANNNLFAADYSGTLYSHITKDQKGKKGEVSMEGFDAGFIEFGTGVTFYGGEYTHPLEGELEIPERGSYGAHQGLLPRWKYHGEIGPSRSAYEIAPGVISTPGNPANRVIYDTGKAIEQALVKRAKEVFDD